MKERKKFCSMRMFEWNQWEREREREREKELNGELLGYILKYKWWCELCANTLSIIYYVSPFSEVHKCTFTNLLMFFFLLCYVYHLYICECMYLSESNSVLCMYVHQQNIIINVCEYAQMCMYVCSQRRTILLVCFWMLGLA